MGFAGIGEVAPIDRLSPEDLEEVPIELERLRNRLETQTLPADVEGVFSFVSKNVSKDFPSIRFGLEVALLDLINGGKKNIFQQDLSDLSLPINGLIWMGDEEFMRDQIKDKLDQGFSCIKLKIGGLDFSTELEIIKSLRQVSSELVIRLDANGAFSPSEALSKLKSLSVFGIHSIEQPILPTQPEAMGIICAKSPVPIALDEELIGVHSSESKAQLLHELKPHFLVLKPTLHGGFAATQEWISLAESSKIGWWITSYLESNVGLNAIAQFASTYDNEEYHGLGTGNLYSNNILSPIVIDQGRFTYATSNVWEQISF